MQKKSSSMLKLAILAIAIVSQINTIASVIMADLAAAFPAAGPTAIQYVMQMGMIGAFPISLSVGFLTKKFRIKSMLMVGLVCILVGGAAPIILHNSLPLLYACALLVGAGQGFMAPLLGTLILQNFEGKSKDSMLGLNTTFSTGGATLLLLLAGPICNTGWVNTYYLYFLVIPVLIVAIMFLPAGDKPVATPAAQGGSKVPVTAKGWIQCLLVVLMFLSYVAFPLNAAMLIIGEGLGDATAASMAMSIITVVGALVGLVFSPVIKVLKLYIGTFAAVCGFLGMLAACMASNLVMIYVSAALLGLFFGASLAGGGYVVGRICTPEQVGPTMSISMSFMTLGIILSPMIINTITTLWGGSGSRGAFATSAGLFGLAVVLQFIWGSYITKTCPEAPAPEDAA